MNARRLVVIGLAGACCAALAGVCGGCAQIFGVDSDRHLVASDAGGAAPTTDGGADWACLGGPPIAAAAGNVVLSMFFNDVTGASSANNFAGTPIPGALMQSCTTDDFLCGSPISSATSDDAGIAKISIPAGFDGYYQVTASSAYTPAILSRSPQQQSEAALQGMVNAQLLAAGGSLAGVPTDSTKSIVIVTATDCASNPAAGIAFTVGAPSANEDVVYISNSLPSKSATQTDVDGSALVFNVPAGTTSVSGSIAATHQPLRSASVTALVRAGWVTYIQIRPDGARYPAP